MSDITEKRPFTHCAEHSENTSTIRELNKNMALLQKDVEYLRRDQEVILARFMKHVEDAEKAGGRHERLKNVEDEIKLLKEQRTNDIIVQRWFMIGSGVIGGLIGSGSAEAVSRFLGLWK